MTDHRFPRLSFDEAVQLFQEDILTLGMRADAMRKAMHPDQRVTFVIDRNINYTNICTCKCSFCAFYREKDAEDAYVLDRETLVAKIHETVALGGSQILMQGGLHPELKIEWYEELLRFIKTEFPKIWLHSFSPPEVAHIASVSGISVDETISRLQKAGLDSIPGGGAELLVDSERLRISPKKLMSEGWLDVMRKAHQHGMKTTATMMFKAGDAPETIVTHLNKIRSLQDETGGFTAFIPWPFQPDRTELGGEHTTALEYLRVLAISRLFLDNVPNIQVSWVTQGPKVGQIGLSFGGNDYGSLMIEENVVASTGVGFRMKQEEIVHTIRQAGFIPAQRDMQYHILRTWE